MNRLAFLVLEDVYHRGHVPLCPIIFGHMMSTFITSAVNLDVVKVVSASPVKVLFSPSDTRSA